MYLTLNDWDIVINISFFKTDDDVSFKKEKSRHNASIGEYTMNLDLT